LDRINLDDEIRKDIGRYERLLMMYRSGEAHTGEVTPLGHLKDTSQEVERHLGNVIKELQALLRDK